MDKFQYNILPFLMLMMIGCSSYHEVETINIDNALKIELLGYMSETDRLVDEALAQYENKYRNMYLVIFRYDDTDTSRYERGIKRLRTYLENPKIHTKQKNENFSFGYDTELYGNMDEEVIFYYHRFFTMDNESFEVCLWTRGEKRKLSYEEDIYRILNSIEPL